MFARYFAESWGWGDLFPVTRDTLIGRAAERPPMRGNKLSNLSKRFILLIPKVNREAPRIPDVGHGWLCIWQSENPARLLRSVVYTLLAENSRCAEAVRNDFLCSAYITAQLSRDTRGLVHKAWTGYVWPQSKWRHVLFI
jgi:hypothetical protein